MYEIRQNTLNEHKYIVWRGAVPSGFKYPSSKMVGKPAQFKMRYLHNGEICLYVAEDWGLLSGQEDILLKCFTEHNIAKNDWDTMFKLGQQFLRRRTE